MRRVVCRYPPAHPLPPARSHHPLPPTAHCRPQMLYNRTVGSGTVVLNGLVDSVCRCAARPSFLCLQVLCI